MVFRVRGAREYFNVPAVNRVGKIISFTPTAATSTYVENDIRAYYPRLKNFFNYGGINKSREKYT